MISVYLVFVLVYSLTTRMLVGTCGDEPGTNCKAEATADALSLQYESFCDESKTFTPEKYLLWIKRQIVAGNPVLIGTYVNQWMDNEDSDPFAGKGARAIDWCVVAYIAHVRTHPRTRVPTSADTRTNTQRFMITCSPSPASTRSTPTTRTTPTM